MDPGVLQLLIAAGCGFLVALVAARSWLWSSLLGALGAVPFAIFSAYMYSGGVEGNGFDGTKLPEGFPQVPEFVALMVVFYGAFGLAGGIASCAVKKVIRRIF